MKVHAFQCFYLKQSWKVLAFSFKETKSLLLDKNLNVVNSSRYYARCIFSVLEMKDYIVHSGFDSKNHNLYLVDPHSLYPNIIYTLDDNKHSNCIARISDDLILVG